MTRTRRGQSTVEFALIALLLFGLIFSVIDLARAGFMQHQLDAGASDLARGITRVTGANSSGDPYSYQPTTLNPAPGATTIYLGVTMPITAAIQLAVTHAAQTANNLFSTASLTSTGAMTLTNGQITVVGTPNLSAPTGITVTVKAPFKPVVTAFLGSASLQLSSTSTTITPFGQQ